VFQYVLLIVVATLVEEGFMHLVDVAHINFGLEFALFAFYGFGLGLSLVLMLMSGKIQTIEVVAQFTFVQFVGGADPVLNHITRT